MLSRGGWRAEGGEAAVRPTNRGTAPPQQHRQPMTAPGCERQSPTAENGPPPNHRRDGDLSASPFSLQLLQPLAIIPKCHTTDTSPGPTPPMEMVNCSAGPRVVGVGHAQVGAWTGGGVGCVDVGGELRELWGGLPDTANPPKLKLSSDDLGHRPPGPFLLSVFSSQLSEHSSFANLIEAGKGGLGGWQCRSRVPKMHTVAHRLSPSLQLLSGVQGFCPIMEARLGGADAHRISSSSTPRRHSGTRQTEPNPQFRAISAHLIDPLRRNAPREMRSQLQALVGRQTSSVVALAPTLSAVLLLDASPLLGSLGWLGCCCSAGTGLSGLSGGALVLLQAI